MAYRQLYTVTFAVLGLVAVACGGETGTNAVPNATEEQAPTNSDAAPTNPDQAAPTDRAPSNPDSAPISATDPAGTGGGGLSGLCRRFCSAIEGAAKDCTDGMLGMADFCSEDIDCQVPPNTPCQNEIADAFDCIIDNLTNLCSADGKEAAPQVALCQQSVKALTDCAGAIDGGDNGSGAGSGAGNGNGNGNGGGACSVANGCVCADTCASCRCAAGTDADALQTCDDLICK